MPSRCIVFGCSNTTKNGVSLHKFPKDPTVSRSWTAKVKLTRGKWSGPTSASVVCSAHFKAEDFETSLHFQFGMTKAKQLLKTAVPSVFKTSIRAKSHSTKSQRDFAQIRERKRVLPATCFACSKHFTKEDFAWNAGGTSRQKKQGTVPSSSSKDKAASNTTKEKAQILRLHDLMVKLQAKIQRGEQDLSRKVTECELLQQQLSIERFCLNRFSRNDALIEFYTGFHSYKQFISFFLFVKPSDDATAVYYRRLQVSPVSVWKKDLQIVDKLFLFMCRFHAGLRDEDLADRFNISVSLVEHTVIFWCNYLYALLSQLPIWLSRDMVTASTPCSFKEHHPNARVILSITELRVQPTNSPNPDVRSLDKSSSCSTFRGLVGLTPNGAVTFLSDLYDDSIIDAQLLTESGILELLEEGDNVLVDGDLKISTLIEAKNAMLTTLPFLRRDELLLRTQDRTDTHRDEQVDSVVRKQVDSVVRKQVESVIRGVKINRIFDSVIPSNLSDYIFQLWTVNCLLCNFKEPLNT